MRWNRKPGDNLGGRTDKSFLINQTPPDFPEPLNHEGNQRKCLHQLAHRTETLLPLHQAQAAITAAATAIPTATGPERARAHALRTARTDTDQTVTTAVAKTKSADTTSEDTEMLQRSRSCSLTKRASYQGAT